MSSSFSVIVNYFISGKAEISGLDEEDKEQVEHYIESYWAQFKNVYLTWRTYNGRS